jgi:hypothetical protein
MSIRHVAALGFALSAGACAAAVPGYVPPDPKLDRIKSSAPVGGGFSSDGNYTMTDQELQLDCKRLTGSMTVKIIQMRDAGNRVQPSAIAASVQNAARPIVGGTTYGENIAGDLARDRARLETLNRQLASKNCATFDLEKELARGNTNPPRATKAGKRV